jgi:shikimate dehydrogenase
MKRFGVIGHPVAHSRSPALHGAFGQATGIELHYERIEVAPAALAGRLAALHAAGYEGLNVTLPHKSAVLPLCVECSARARRAGAVNTLSREAAGWRGDNTDGAGLIADLRRLGVALGGRRLLILGAGGAVRGILEPLLAAQPAHLVVANRNPWKPEAIAADFAALGPVIPRTYLALKGDVFDVVIHATSAGHGGEMPRLPGGLFAEGAVAYDLSYGAAHEPFARWARAEGAAAVHDGYGMLVEQAAESFRLWTGKVPPTGPLHRD